MGNTSIDFFSGKTTLNYTQRSFFRWWISTNTTLSFLINMDPSPPLLSFRFFSLYKPKNIIMKYAYP